ncbi:MAG TPA: hypothetical protein VLA00_12890 [Xanthobacteraceae bacterium]|nr:hypothetical protein [Xanthobacteraceae bacterium]
MSRTKRSLNLTQRSGGVVRQLGREALWFAAPLALLAAGAGLLLASPAASGSTLLAYCAFAVGLVGLLRALVLAPALSRSARRPPRLRRSI